MTPPLAVAVAMLLATATRVLTLRVDYRQYPSYPQGYVIHLSLALIAAFLGALAAPALLAREYAAASFLALAATQFREVRRIEREALANLEETELVKRGTAYIEGIARVFEARNYVVMLAALLSSAALVLLDRRPAQAVAAALVVTGTVAATVGRTGRGPRVADVAKVRPASVTFEGPLLTVEGTVLFNVGRRQARETYLEQAMAAVIEPRDSAAGATLAHPGQRQAILHDVVARVGVRMDVDEPEFSPVARRNVGTGAVVLVVIPVIRDFELLADAVRSVPLLEASVRLTGYGEDRRPGPRGIARYGGGHARRAGAAGDAGGGSGAGRRPGSPE